MPSHLVDPPDTELARWAHDLLHESCEAHLIGHSERSYQLAALVAAHEGVDVDEEVVYIGTILHDIGLAWRFSGTERFEARGANAVRAALLEAGMAPVRAEGVWDVIALHATTALAAHKSAETRIANRGISIDVRGAGADDLPTDAVRAVLDAWPRAEFPAAFAGTLVDEVRANPGSVRMSWLESVAVRSVPGYQPSDFLAALHASADFT